MEEILNNENQAKKPSLIGATPLQLAEAIAEILDDTRAKDIKIVELKGKYQDRDGKGAALLKGLCFSAMGMR